MASKTPNYDSKIKEILDNLQPGERTCEMTGEKWMMDEEEIGWYKKLHLPPSPFSPKARLYHLSAFFCVYQWWWNKHFDTDKPVLTYIHPASGVKVLPDKEWFTRDFSTTNLEIDLSKPFFETLRSLQLSVPFNATGNFEDPENSITSRSFGDQNSLFVSACKSKNSYYLCNCDDAEGCMDCDDCMKITDTYHAIFSNRLHNCKYMKDCHDCIDSSFMFDCRNCESCFGASNKRNKKFLFWNEQLSEEEWKKRVSEIDLGDRAVLDETIAKYEKMINGAVWPENFNIGCTDSTGEYLIDCSNTEFSSFGRDAHNCSYGFGLWGAKECAFCCILPGERCYQNGPSANCSDSHYSVSLTRCDDVEYSMNCYDCSHCFGCVGLRHKKFHILNKEYSEDEYYKKVDEIKCKMLERSEYGRPIPTSFSMSYYPESGPYVYMGAEMKDWDMTGIPKFEASAEGAFGEVRMRDKELIPREEIPKHVRDLDPEKWAGVAIDDPDTKRPFTYLKPEIAFYKKHNIAPPILHFSTRVRDMIREVNNGVFEKTSCSSCDKELIVATNFMYTRKIYCKECYLKYLETNG